MSDDRERYDDEFGDKEERDGRHDTERNKVDACWNLRLRMFSMNPRFLNYWHLSEDSFFRTLSDVFEGVRYVDVSCLNSQFQKVNMS